MTRTVDTSCPQVSELVFTSFQPGLRTGRWATPHKTCANTNPVGWRGQIDVDLTNWAAPYGKHYSPAKNLNCSPA